VRRLVLGVALAAGAACAACAAPPTYAVGVTPGPTPSAPAFAVPGATDGLYGLSVERCGGGGTMWAIGTGGGNVSRPASVVYGRAPDGWMTRAGPLPLVAGCYDVFASGGGVGRFTVRADGTLAP